jgi:YHS domain-containing protein
MPFQPQSCRGFLLGNRGILPFFETATQESAMAKAKDPVCKMEVDEEKAAGTSEHQGHKYFFCSASCKKKFDQDPARYVSK